MFAIQIVLCGSLAGNKSDPIMVTTTTSLTQERNNADRCTNTAYLATISSLVVALITSVEAFSTAIVIILQRRKAKIKELQLVPSNRATSSTRMEPMAMYEDTSPSVRAINTKENVAYGHTKTEIGLGAINTKENVAYMAPQKQQHLPL
jgi:hypothetical protein